MFEIPSSHIPCQEFQWLEFYAGVGRLTTMMHASEYRSARFDLLDNDQPSYRKSNFMDLTHSSGYAFLECIVCWVSVSYKFIHRHIARGFWMSSTEAGYSVPFAGRSQWICKPLWGEVLFIFQDECGDQSTISVRACRTHPLQVSCVGQQAIGKDWFWKIIRRCRSMIRTFNRRV